MHRARELICQAELRAPLAVLRLTGTYGAGDQRNAYGPNRFLRTALSEGSINLFGRGEELRDHIYVEDVARVLLWFSRNSIAATMNVVSGVSISFAELAEMVAELTGANIKLLERERPIRHRRFDTSLRRKLMPEFSPTSLQIGLRKMWDELARQHADMRALREI